MDSATYKTAWAAASCGRRTTGSLAPKGLISLMAALVGTGVYLNVGSGKVNIALSDPVMVVLVAVFFVRYCVTRTPVRITQSVKLSVILWYTWCTAIVLSTIVPAALGYADLRILGMAVLKTVVNGVYALFVPLALSNSILDRGKVTWMLRVWVVVAAAQVFLAWIPPVHATVYLEGRFRGLFRDPNLYSVFAAQSAALSLGLMRNHLPIERTVGLCGGILCSVGVVLSGSRTGLASLGATVLFAAVMMPRFGRSLAIAASGVAATMWYASSRFPDVQAMMSRIGRASIYAGLSARSDTWASVLAAIQYSPLWGVGRDHYVAWKQSIGISSQAIAHNTYLGVIAETGVLGALPFMLLFVGMPTVVILNVLRRREARRDAVLASVALALPAFWAGGMGISIENYRAGWLLTGVLMGLAQTSWVPLPARSGACGSESGRLACHE